MEQRSKHIDNLFREGLSNYKEAPSSGVWDALAQRLPVAPLAANKHSYKWLWLLLLLSVVALLSYFAAKNWTSLSSNNNAKQTDNIFKESITKHHTNSSIIKDTTITSLPKNEIEKGNVDKDVVSNTSLSASIKKHSKSKPEYNDERSEIRHSSKLVNPEKTNNSSTPNSHNETNNFANELTNKSDEISTTAPNAIGNNTAIKTNRKKQKADNFKANGKLGKKLKTSTSTKENTSTKNTNNALANNENDSNNEKNVQQTGVINTAQTEEEISSDNRDNNEQNKQTDNVAPNPKNTKNGTQKLAKTDTNKPKQKEAINKAGKKIINTAKQTDNSKHNTSSKQDINNEMVTNDTKQDNQVAKNATNINEENSHGLVENFNSKTQNETAKKQAGLKAPTSAGKPIAVKPETSKGKPINVTAEPNQAKNSEELVADNFTKKDVAPVANAKFNKKELAANNNTTTSKSGIKINPPTTLKQPETKALNEGVNLDKYLANIANEEAKLNAEEEAATINPQAGASMGTGSGGAGDNYAPSVPLRNFKESPFSGGLKVGYDKGFGKYSTSNIVIAPFLQWNISDKISLWLQPGFRYNNINKTSLADERTYHDVISQSRDSSHVVSTDSMGISRIQRNYIYRNQYDSVKVTYGIKATNFWEVELPLSIQYHISPSFAVQLGGMLSFGEIVAVEGGQQRFSGFSKTDSLAYAPVPYNGQPSSNYPNPPSIQNYFHYNTPSYQSIDTSQYSNAPNNPARFALMFGFSYTYKSRLLIDVLVRKNISSMNFIPNEQVRSIYTQPYFRLTIGYKFFGGSKRTNTNTSGL